MVLLPTIFRDISLYVTVSEVGIKVPKYEMHLVNHQLHIGAVEKERNKLSGCLCNILEESTVGGRRKRRWGEEREEINPEESPTGQTRE